jgi:Ca2+-binding RTX toxin-like protein
LQPLEFMGETGMATINGTAGPDTLTGDDSDEDGVGGSDVIHGGGGNDTIDGLGGTNQIYGDDGDDLIRLTKFGTDARSTIDGGAGTDTLDLSGSPDAVFISEIDPVGGTFMVKWSDGIFPWGDGIAEGTSIERFVLGGQYSWLNLPNWTAPLYVQATYGNGRISTGRGDDTIMGGAHGGTFTLNGGNDVVVTGGGYNGINIARISANRDHIQIDARVGDGAGLSFESAAVAGRIVTVDLASGSASLGSTTISFSGIRDVGFSGMGAITTIYGDDGNNSISASRSESAFGMEAHGRGGTDYLIGGLGNDSLFGDAGDDHIEGYGGNDVLEGGDGHDWLEGDSDDNQDAGSDTILGGAGNDHIWGYGQSNSPGNATDLGDYIDGGDGSDYVNGNGGADTILGGRGSDRLYGGSGDGPDQINGNKGNDTIHGGDGTDILRGGQGDDVITGGGGDDVMYGDLGNDTLHAGQGVDFLTGGGGADRFDFSDPGAASIDPSGYVSTILDFENGVDDIRLSFTPGVADILRSSDSYTSVATAQAAAQALLSAHGGTSDVAALQVGADTYLFYNAAGTGDTITAVVALSGVDAASIDSSDFA